MSVPVTESVSGLCKGQIWLALLQWFWLVVWQSWTLVGHGKPDHTHGRLLDACDHAWSMSRQKEPRACVCSLRRRAQCCAGMSQQGFSCKLALTHHSKVSKSTLLNYDHCFDFEIDSSIWKIKNLSYGNYFKQKAEWLMTDTWLLYIRLLYWIWTNRWLEAWSIELMVFWGFHKWHSKGYL